MGCVWIYALIGRDGHLGCGYPPGLPEGGNVWFFERRSIRKLCFEMGDQTANNLQMIVNLLSL